MNDDDENVFRFGTVAGGKGEEAAEDDATPTNDYVIVDIDGNEFYEHGFLIFTPYHAAIMRDHAKGALPLLVVPIARVKVAAIDEDNED